MASPSAAGRAFWDRNARRYDRSMLLFRRPMARAVELVREEARGLGPVLEIAAGSGAVTLAVAPVVEALLATDYSPAMVELLEARVREAGLQNVDVIERNVHALGFPPRTFDAVICANVLHLLPDLPGALAAMRAVLRPGGKLLAPTFAHAETRASRAVSRVLALTGFPGARRLSAATLRDAVAAAGFEPYRQELVPGLLPIAFLAARAT